MFSRKIVSASLSSTLFAIVLSLIMSTFYRESWIVGQNYFISTAAILNIFLLYLFPAVLIYGVITSIISDTIAEFLAKKRHNLYMVLIISGILHILFGLVLIPYSLIAAITFFITDKILEKKKYTGFSWIQAFLFLLIPISLWLLTWGVVGIVVDYVEMN